MAVSVVEMVTKTDVPVTTDSDGIISYDTDGDSKPDIILTPLI